MPRRRERQLPPPSPLPGGEAALAFQRQRAAPRGSFPESQGVLKSPVWLKSKCENYSPPGSIFIESKYMEAFETRSKKQNGSYVTSSDPGEERHVPYEAASRSGVESPTRGRGQWEDGALQLLGGFRAAFARAPRSLPHDMCKHTVPNPRVF